jgi:hypothetical protein
VAAVQFQEAGFWHQPANSLAVGADQRRSSAGGRGALNQAGRHDEHRKLDGGQQSGQIPAKTGP